MASTGSSSGGGVHQQHVLAHLIDTHKFPGPQLQEALC